jgi:hypothetical protein
MLEAFVYQRVYTLHAVERSAVYRRKRHCRRVEIANQQVADLERVNGG